VIAKEFVEERITKQQDIVTKSILIDMLQDFARLKCEEQRELCAKEIKRNAVIFDILGINQETILNSPEPEI
jgi:spore coat polysaccharide biosynthesis predicted glycosyltransferase SpsG